MKPQRGIALLLMLLLLLSLSAAWLIQRVPQHLLVQQRQERTARALGEAKDALLAWSANSSPPGMLPCPEDSSLIGYATEGQARSSCTNTDVHIGRLPWRTLKLPELRDGNGDRLWYVLAPGFRNAPINSNSPAGITLDGVNAAAVALIISPGIASTGQLRPKLLLKGANLVATDYLDGINANGGGSGGSSNGKQFSTQENDKILAITAAEWAKAVEARVLQEVEQALWRYYCGWNNVGRDGACLSPNGGQRFFPAPAAINDTTCFGINSLDPLTNPCPPQSGVILGRIPATPNPLWSDMDANSPLRGVASKTLDWTKDWLQKNGWRELIFYSPAQPCRSPNCSGSGGFLSLQARPWADKNNLKVMLLTSGVPLPTQSRSSTSDKSNLANFLEQDSTWWQNGKFLGGAAVPGKFNDSVRGLR